MLIQNTNSLNSFPLTAFGAGDAVLLGQREQTLFMLRVGGAGMRDVTAIPSGYGVGRAWYPALAGGAVVARGDASTSGTAVVTDSQRITASGVAVSNGIGVVGNDISVVGVGSASSIATATPRAEVGVVGAGSASSVGVAIASADVRVVATGSAASSSSAVVSAEVFIVGVAGGPEPLSPEGLANAVWAAIATENNVAGTMGSKLNAAGGAADPWAVELETGFTAERILRIIAAVVAGKSTGGPDGPVFRSISDDQDQVTGVATVAGDRTGVTYGS